MSLIPIPLGVRRKPGAGGAVLKDRPPSKSQSGKTLARDDFACRCCGFRAERHQRVISADAFRGVGDPYVTVCLFCELCLNLDHAGLAGRGILIWLPEIAQADLHHIMRAIYVARSGDHALASQATRALDALMARRADVKKRLGSDDPLLLATALHENLTDEEYARRTTKLDGVRLLPLDRWLVRGASGDIDQFPRLVQYWRSPQGPYGKLPVEKWTGLFDSVTAKLGGAH